METGVRTVTQPAAAVHGGVDVAVAQEGQKRSFDSI